MIFSSIVGSFLKNKGVHIYLEAIKDIKELNFELVGIYGSDEKYNDFVKSLISKNVVLKGFINNIKNYYEKIDVLVHTSIEHDSLPTVLIEGLAKGKILIATDVGGVREIVDDSYGNIIIPPNDIEALKEAILEVSAYNKEKIDLIKNRNVAIAKEKFTLKKQVDKIQNLYQELLL